MWHVYAIILFFHAHGLCNLIHFIDNSPSRQKKHKLNSNLMTIFNVQMQFCHKNAYPGVYNYCGTNDSTSNFSCVVNEKKTKTFTFTIRLLCNQFLR